MSEGIGQREFIPGDWFWLLLVALFCALLMLAFPLFGVPVGYDLTQHFRFAAEYHDALVDGPIVPLWAGVDNLGFGSIGIRFYPPLADLALGVTQLFTKDWFQTMWLNSFFWMFPGAFGVYLWMRELRPPTYAAFAAILYAAMPYHVMQIYHLQLYSEFVAASILPFCFLFSTKLVRRGKPADILGLAVSCSLLLHTHLPASMIGFTGLAVFTAIIFNWSDPLASIGKFVCAAALTVGSAAYYLLRLGTEMNWVKHSSAEFSSGFFDHRNHFFPLASNFADRYWELDLWQIDLSVVFVGLILVPLIVGCFIWRKALPVDAFNRKIHLAVSITGLFAVFMLSSMSSFVWNTFTIFQKIQFPWRFLSLASLLASVSLALVLAALIERHKSFNRVFIYAATGVILAAVFFDITQTIGISGQVSSDKYHETVVSKRADESCKCWWPAWAESGAFENKERVTAANRAVSVTVWENVSRSFTVDNGAATDARIATFYYPYWKATVNGTPVETRKDENGTILIPLSESSSAVHLYFEEPRYYSAAFYLSVATNAVFMAGFLILLFAIVAGKKKKLFPNT